MYVEFVLAFWLLLVITLRFNWWFRLIVSGGLGVLFALIVCLTLLVLLHCDRLLLVYFSVYLWFGLRGLVSCGLDSLIWIWIVIGLL